MLRLTEFMHPRIEEVCGTMPAALGAAVLKRKGLVSALNRVVNKGRHVRTDTHPLVPGALRSSPVFAASAAGRFATASRRRIWRIGSRPRVETLRKDYALAVEVLRCRRLIKGYSDTHERGTSKYDRVLSALPLLEGRSDGAEWLHRLIEAALKDEEGEMLDGALKTVKTL